MPTGNCPRTGNSSASVLSHCRRCSGFDHRELLALRKRAQHSRNVICLASSARAWPYARASPRSGRYRPGEACALPRPAHGLLRGSECEPARCRDRASDRASRSEISTGENRRALRAEEPGAIPYMPGFFARCTARLLNRLSCRAMCPTPCPYPERRHYFTAATMQYAGLQVVPGSQALLKN